MSGKEELVVVERGRGRAHKPGSTWCTGKADSVPKQGQTVREKGGVVVACLVSPFEAPHKPRRTQKRTN